MTESGYPVSRIRTTCHLNFWMGHAGPTLGFSWFIIVSLVVMSWTVGSSVGQDLLRPDGEALEIVLKEHRQGSTVDHPSPAYQYESENRREPFLPLISPEHPQRGSASIGSRATGSEPAVKILGIMSGTQGTYATIENSGGKRYLVAPGSVIPSEGLKVKRIRETELELEYLDEGNGRNKPGQPHWFIVSF